MSYVTTHRRHLLVVVSCCLMVGISLGLFTNAYGVFYTPLAEKLGTGRGAVALHATIAGVVTALSQPLMVRMLKKIRLQWMILVGMLLMSGTTVLTAMVDSVWLLDLIGVIRGIGIGCCYVPVVTTVLGNWFFQRYGLVSGITLSFSGLSGAILSQLLTNMLSRYGMRFTLLLTAAVIVILLLPALLFVRATPQEAGVLPFGEQGKGPSGTAPMQDSLERSNTVLYTICFAGALSALLFSFPQHLTSYTQTIGLSAEVGATMMSAVMVGNILFKLLSGVLADVIGAFRSAAVFLAAATAAMLVLFFCPKNSLVLVISAFFLGASYAYNAVGLSNVTRAVFGSDGYGKAFSVVNAVSCVSSSLLLSVIGFSYDWTGGYRLAAAVGVLCGATGLICFAILRKKLRLK